MELTASAWSAFGDAHDYSRTGKHDPNGCRFCLREQLVRLQAIQAHQADVDAEQTTLEQVLGQELREAKVRIEQLEAYFEPEVSASVALPIALARIAALEAELQHR